MLYKRKEQLFSEIIVLVALLVSLIQRS